MEGHIDLRAAWWRPPEAQACVGGARTALVHQLTRHTLIGWRRRRDRPPTNQRPGYWPTPTEAIKGRQLIQNIAKISLDIKCGGPRMKNRDGRGTYEAAQSPEGYKMSITKRTKVVR